MVSEAKIEDDRDPMWTEPIAFAAKLPRLKT